MIDIDYRDALKQLIFNPDKEPATELGFGIFLKENDEIVVNTPASGDHNSILGSNIFENGNLVYGPGYGFHEPMLSQILYSFHTHPYTDENILGDKVKILEYPSLADILHLQYHTSINRDLEPDLIFNPVMTIICNYSKRIFQMRLHEDCVNMSCFKFLTALEDICADMYIKRFPKSKEKFEPDTILKPFDHIVLVEGQPAVSRQFPRYLINKSCLDKFCTKARIHFRSVSFDEFFDPGNDCFMRFQYKNMTEPELDEEEYTDEEYEEEMRIIERENLTSFDNND